MRTKLLDKKTTQTGESRGKKQWTSRLKPNEKTKKPSELVVTSVQTPCLTRRVSCFQRQVYIEELLLTVQC